MNIARLPIWLLFLPVLFAPLPAEHAFAAAPALLKTGTNAQVRLLMTAPLPPDQQSPSGMGFLFLVTPTTAANANFAIKETRDFQLDGASYQERTQSELGRRFEPNTQVLDAGKFFIDNPPLKPSDATEVPKGALVISITIRGTSVTAGAMTGITLSVGYDKQVEDFAFSFTAT